MTRYTEDLKEMIIRITKKVSELEDDFLEYLQKENILELISFYEKNLKEELIWQELIKDFSVSKYLGSFKNLEYSEYFKEIEELGYHLSVNDHKNVYKINKHLILFFESQDLSDFIIMNLSEGKSDMFLVIISGYVILIDSSTSKGSNDLFNMLKKGCLKHVLAIDIVVITHCDNDHIGGMKRLLKADQFKDSVIVYNRFTSGVISYRQAENFESAVNGRKIVTSYHEKHKKFFKTLTFLRFDERKMLPKLKHNNIYFTLIHPEKLGVEKVYADYMRCKSQKINSGNGKVINKNSIVFLLEYRGKTVLFSGDAYIRDFYPILLTMKKEIPVILKKIDCFKIPHHGAVENNNMLLELIEEFKITNLILTTSSQNIYEKNNLHNTIIEMITNNTNKYYVFENQSNIPGLNTGLIDMSVWRD